MPKSKSNSSSKSASKPKVRPPLSFQQTSQTIKTDARWNRKTHIDKLADIILRARKAAVERGDRPEKASPAELLTQFRPTPAELKRQGLGSDFRLDDKCSNNTALFMTDFAFYADAKKSAAKKKSTSPVANKSKASSAKKRKP